MWNLRTNGQRAFTLIELMIVVAIIGLLAAVAIPAFMKYIQKSKTSEARQFVKKLYDGAREYYLDRRGGRTMAPVAAQFPRPSMDNTPAIDACCSSGDKCAPDATLWTNPTWMALKFSVSDPHHYTYAYRVQAAAYTARANGDLDCDGTYATFEMFGEINSVYADGPSGSASLYRENALE